MGDGAVCCLILTLVFVLLVRPPPPPQLLLYHLYFMVLPYRVNSQEGVVAGRIIPHMYSSKFRVGATRRPLPPISERHKRKGLAGARPMTHDGRNHAK